MRAENNIPKRKKIKGVLILYFQEYSYTTGDYILEKIHNYMYSGKCSTGGGLSRVSGPKKSSH